MDQACKHDEAVLLEYLLGTAQLELRDEIQGSAPCRAAAEALAGRLSALYRWECPDEQLLVAYNERRIADSTLELMLRAHVEACALCGEELLLLAAVDELPLWPRPHPLRRVIKAVYRAPLAQPLPLRGDMLHYDAEQWSVQLRVRSEIEHAGRWTVRGQLRSAGGALAGGVLQAVRAYRAQQAEPIEGSVEAGGAFRLSELEAGSYAFALELADQRIEFDLLVGTL